VSWFWKISLAASRSWRESLAASGRTEWEHPEMDDREITKIRTELVTASEGFADPAHEFATAIAAIVTFSGVWFSCASAYGVWLGFGLGWLPASILGLIMYGIVSSVWGVIANPR